MLDKINTVCYYNNTKRKEEKKMAVFDFVILCLFVVALAFQFVSSMMKNCHTLMAVFGFELVAFAYLALRLM